MTELPFRRWRFVLPNLCSLMLMDRFKVLLFVLVLLPLAASAQTRPEARVKGEILVKFRPGTSAEAARGMILKKGSVTLERFSGIGWVRLKLPKGRSIDQAIAEYKESGLVEAVQPNYYYHLLTTPNDPNFGTMWGLTKISAPQAWDLATGSPTVVVADIDTGIKYDHPDLAANVWTNPGEINGNGIDDDSNGFIDDYYGYDFFFNDPDPLDEHGHGTHTAGTIGAVGNNAVGVVGVNWNVKIMAIKIYDSDGLGTTSAMLINAYNYVRLMKERGVNIRVTNNSYGGCDEACGYDQATKDAIDALGRTGVLQVFAAGNDGMNIDTTPSYPAAYNSPWIISVANSTSSDTRAGSSNFGVANVDLAAPGTSILSTTNSGTGYGTLSGTSMATPHVAGTAALLAAYNPNLSSASIKATLLNTVDQLAAWNGVVKTGGRLNAAAALQNQTVCTFSVPGGPITLPTKGGYFSINVTAAPNCDYEVKSDANWIKLQSSASLSGNGTATFRATLNPTITRSGTISVGGTIVTVLQSRS